MSRATLLASVVGVFVVGTVAVCNDWDIADPTNTNPASTITGGGTGPADQEGTCILYKWNGNYYGSYGSVVPTPVQADDYGMWEVTMYPAEGVDEFFVADYAMTIGDAETHHFSVVSGG